MKTNQKGFAHYLVFVIVGVVVIGAAGLTAWKLRQRNINAHAGGWTDVGVLSGNQKASSKYPQLLACYTKSGNQKRIKFMISNVSNSNWDGGMSLFRGDNPIDAVHTSAVAHRYSPVKTFKVLANDTDKLYAVYYQPNSGGKGGGVQSDWPTVSKITKVCD